MSQTNVEKGSAQWLRAEHQLAKKRYQQNQSETRIVERRYARALQTACQLISLHTVTH